MNTRPAHRCPPRGAAVVAAALALLALLAVYGAPRPAAAAPTTAPAAESAARPNFVIFLADDLNWYDTQPYGSTNVKTPHLARLAREGMKMNGMFDVSPMCAPTRQALYTGMFPVRNGAHPNHSHVYDGVRSVAQELQAAGYRTALVGKRHFGPPESFPFEFIPGPQHDGGDGPAFGEFSFDAVRDFITRDAAQPYLLIVCSNQPHTPWNRGDPSVFDADKLALPPYVADTPRTRQLLTRYYGEVAYLDEQVGRLLAILDDAPSAKDAAGTMTMFLSEQGAQVPGGKWTCYDPGLKAAALVRWPGHVAAGSASDALCQYVDVVPTLLDAAGVDPATVDTGVADAHGGRGFDGRSFLKVLTGQSDHLRDVVFGVQTTRGIVRGSQSYPIRMARGPRYKLLWNPQYDAAFQNVVTEAGPNSMFASWRKVGESDPQVKFLADRYTRRPEWELYDLKTDPWELHDLLADGKAPADLDPEAASAMAGLKEQLAAWMEQQGDKGIATEMDAKNRQEHGDGEGD